MGAPFNLYKEDLDYPPSFWQADEEENPRVSVKKREPRISYPGWYVKLLFLLSYLVTAELFFVIGFLFRNYR